MAELTRGKRGKKLVSDAGALYRSNRIERLLPIRLHWPGAPSLCVHSFNNPIASIHFPARAGHWRISSGVF
ncbi:MAG TPA: hypothetical protein PK529_04055, partial [Verrucomicrobiales bacterium]|nr:hypothetical protein [Verrucomicrobiales bacterium]